MPMFIPHIDAIARARQRDVLYVEFRHREFDDGHGFVIDSMDAAWELHASRRQLIRWLDAHDIAWLPCGHFADAKNQFRAYCGQLYIDTPFDTRLPAYQALQAFLEHPDGTPRLADTVLCVLPLRVALRNARQDELLRGREA